jgi:hypothetical protein
MAASADFQTTAGKNLCVLALLCTTQPVNPDEVLRLLHEATAKATQPLSKFLDPLLRVQETFNRCIEDLRKFGEEDRRYFHSILTHRIQFIRYSVFLPSFDRDIKDLEQTIQTKQDRIGILQDRIKRNVGRKVDQKDERDRLLAENSSTRVKLDKLKTLRQNTFSKAQHASHLASLERQKLSQEVDKEVFKEFEALIQEREVLKSQFFLSNNWGKLLTEEKVQTAFDAILRSVGPKPLAKMGPPPLSFWQWICCCRSISRIR